MQEVTFSTKIKLYRTQFGWTQSALAEKVGVSRETITYLEKGKYNPSLKLAFCVAHVLKTTINDLFDFDIEE